MSHLNFTDRQTGLTWRQDMYAAKLVTPGYHGLPPKIGDFRFIPLHNPGMYGIPKHALESVYPGISIAHFAMVIPAAFKVKAADGKEGVAFWINNNGSDFCVSVTSEMGRSNVAPLDWEGERAVAHPYWEWRSEVEDNKVYPWTNARVHGFPGLDGRDAGLDWLDGTPTRLSTMYDRVKGQTAQSVVVPRIYEIGTAAQTLPADAYVGTYSIMLYFPLPEAVLLARKLSQFPSLMTPEQAMSRGAMRKGDDYVFSTRSTSPKPKGFESLERGGLELFTTQSLEPSFEVTHGFEMRQHILMPPLFPNFWRQDPSVVIVCWPIGEEQEAAIARPNVRPGREGFGWHSPEGMGG